MTQSAAIAAMLLCTATAYAKPDIIITIKGRREPAEAAVSSKSIKYLTFSVPVGVTGITIKKELKQGPGEQRGTIDHGLFDPRGADPGGPGFRGWMGGSSEDMVIDGSMSDSQFFIGGPIQPGTWTLAQWYLVASPGGLDYKYTVTLSFSGKRPPAKMPAVPRYNPGIINAEKKWYIGGLHNHTVASDGARTLADLVRFHMDSGFEFLIATDHNTVRQHYEFAAAQKAHPDFLILSGEELTSPFGHANIIGGVPGSWYDFRIDGGDGNLPKLIAKAHAQGAVFSVNHPFADCTTCRWRYPANEYASADALEVWNGIWDSTDALALGLWDQMLKNGRHIIALGGADYHRGEDPITPAAWVYADNLSQRAILDGIKGGRVVLTDGRFGARVTITARNGAVMGGDTVTMPVGKPLPVEIRVVRGQMYNVHLVWATGDVTLLPTSADCTLKYSVPAGAKYVRAELVAGDRSIASLTNPIYIKDQGLSAGG